MADRIVRPKAVTQLRGLHMTPQGTLLINHHDSSAPLYEVVPGKHPIGGPCLYFFDVSPGRAQDERRLVMTLSTHGAGWLARFLPQLIRMAIQK